LLKLTIFGLLVFQLLPGLSCLGMQFGLVIAKGLYSALEI
jgi:hypothetical protein